MYYRYNIFLAFINKLILSFSDKISNEIDIKSKLSIWFFPSGIDILYNNTHKNINISHFIDTTIKTSWILVYFCL